MVRRPWESQSSIQTTTDDGRTAEIPVIEKNIKILAEFLGARNEGEDLAVKVKSIVEEYLQTPQGASEWLLNNKEFSWDDLFQAFTHGCRNANNDKELCLSEMVYNEEYGHHIMILGPSITFQTYLARAFYLAASFSTECDGIIRWELYNGDWIRYLCQIRVSSQEIIRILDLRSLDFFLPEINSNEWDSSWNVPGLFEQISSLGLALELLGRVEEAEALRIDLAERKKAFGLISKNIPPNQPKNEVRLAAEKAWLDCLGPTTWEALLSESRNDLVDAFSVERAVDAGYYKSWRYALQPMLHMVERELNHSIFSILKKSITSTTSFTPLNSRSASRQRTFESVVRANKNGRLLTLGELSFVLKFWDDPVMDKCTDLFYQARSLLNTISSSSEIHMQVLRAAFQDTFGQIDPSWNLVKLRNSCAHPGNEQPLRDKEMFTQLKVTLSKPPRNLIETVVVHLRGIALDSGKG